MNTQSVSQSVARMVAILEKFERERRALSSAELTTGVDAPRSSIAALLRAMVDLGVLSLDRRSSTYLPTAHFARLAHWLTDVVTQDPRLIDMMKRLQTKTTETVTLSIPTDVCMEIMLVERSSQMISFTAEAGQRITFWGSAIGTAYLSTLPSASMQTLYERSARHGGELAPTQPFATVQTLIAQMREQGCAIAFGAVFPDASAMAIPLPAHVGLRQCVLSIAGPTDRLQPRVEEFVSLMAEERSLF